MKNLTRNIAIGLLAPLTFLAIAACVVRFREAPDTTSNVKITNGSHSFRDVDIVLTVDSVNHVYCYTLYQSAISCVSK
jgi:hypothetical protein